MKPGQSLPVAALILFATTGSAAPKPDEPVDTVFHSKPTAPIAIDWEQSAPPVVGQTLEIVLTITSEVELSGGRLTLAVDDPLVLIGPAAETALGTLAPGEPGTFVVTVLPLVAATQYLRVAVAGESGGGPQLRAVSVPVRFETAVPDKDASPLSLAPANAVQSLKAVETVY